MGRVVLVTEVKEAGHCPQVEVGEGFTNLLLESGTFQKLPEWPVVDYIAVLA